VSVENTADAVADALALAPLAVRKLDARAWRAVVGLLRRSRQAVACIAGVCV
jgi:hypothetical protein